MEKILEILAAVTGIGMSLAYYPQAYRIYKHKSAEDISLLSYALFSIGTFIWLAYGIVKRDPIVIWGFIFGVAGSWLVLALSLIYKKKRKT